jgi:hypothetical protein
LTRQGRAQEYGWSALGDKIVASMSTIKHC